MQSTFTPILSSYCKLELLHTCIYYVHNRDDDVPYKVAQVEECFRIKSRSFSFNVFGYTIVMVS